MGGESRGVAKKLTRLLKICWLSFWVGAATLNGVSVETLQRARLNGSRRVARLFLGDLEIEEHPKGVCFAFSLPKGSYATTLMREFMKSEEGVTDPTEGES